MKLNDAIKRLRRHNPKSVGTCGKYSNVYDELADYVRDLETVVEAFFSSEGVPADYRGAGGRTSAMTQAEYDECRIAAFFAGN